MCNIGQLEKIKSIIMNPEVKIEQYKLTELYSDVLNEISLSFKEMAKQFKFK